MIELYEKDRATGEQSKTALEMREQWATSTGEGSMENIEDIDHLVAQNCLVIVQFVFTIYF